MTDSTPRVLDACELAERFRWEPELFEHTKVHESWSVDGEDVVSLVHVPAQDVMLPGEKFFDDEELAHSPEFWWVMADGTDDEAFLDEAEALAFYRVVWDNMHECTVSRALNELDWPESDARRAEEQLPGAERAVDEARRALDAARAALGDRSYLEAPEAHGRVADTDLALYHARTDLDSLRDELDRLNRLIRHHRETIADARDQEFDL